MDGKTEDGLTSVKGWPVMKVKCPTCPFRDNPERDQELASLRATVEARVLGTASQICHHHETHGGKNSHLCRGARDFQLETFFRIGWIDSPTDAGWTAKMKELGLE